MNYERIAAGLQKKISDIVARYEGDLAILQEQATQEIERLTQEVEDLKTQLGELTSVAEGSEKSEKSDK